MVGKDGLFCFAFCSLSDLGGRKEEESGEQTVLYQRHPPQRKVFLVFHRKGGRIAFFFSFMENVCVCVLDGRAVYNLAKKDLLGLKGLRDAPTSRVHLMKMIVCVFTVQRQTKMIWLWFVVHLAPVSCLHRSNCSIQLNYAW